MSMLYPISGRRHNLFSEIDNAINDIFGPTYRPMKSNKFKSISYSTTPKANVMYTDEGYRLDLAAPGFSKGEFDINIEENVLTVSINSEDTKEYKEKLLRREYSYATFSRSWTLPENTVAKNINARYESGILSLFIPVEKEHRVSTKINVE
tara:strand:- start:1016 stop:1468 length:453 start_codon:yes stop_codon:yes gene_type:complete